jgi:outer membrane protein assembly factor BamB
MWKAPVVSETVAYFCVGRTLVALDITTWSMIWSFTDGRRELTTPTVSGDRVYLPASLPHDGVLYRLNAATGEIEWSHSIGAQIGPVAVGNGMVYAGYGTYWLGPYGIRAIDEETCITVWDYQTPVHNFGPPALSVDQSLLVVARRNMVFCFDALTGEVRWTYSAGSAWQVWVPAIENSTVYAYNAGRNSTWAFAIDLTTGDEIWKTDLPRVSDRVQPPAVSDARLYVSLGEHMYALDCLTGCMLWDLENYPGVLNNAPVACGGGIVYFTAGDSLFAANAETGDVLWKYCLGADAADCIPGIYDDRIYTLNGRGELLTFVGQSAPQEVQATVEFKPDVLNRKSRGRWVTCYIELPRGYDPVDIDLSSIVLNGIIAPESRPIATADFDRDSIPDLMVKFSRNKLLASLASDSEIEIAVEGALENGESFSGADTVRIVNNQSLTSNLAAGDGALVSSGSAASYASVSFTIREPGPVRLRIFDVHGRLVCTLVQDVKAAGEYQITWDGTTVTGRRASAGVYFARLEHQNQASVAKILLVR